MSEKTIEAVARALCKAADDDWDWSVFYIVDGNDTAETAQNLFREMARAAIKAYEAAKMAEKHAMQAKIEEMKSAIDIEMWDNAMPKASIMPSEDLNAVVVHVDGYGQRVAIMCKDQVYKARLEIMANEIIKGFWP